jgi:class 3 adenylate cyclase
MPETVIFLSQLDYSPALASYTNGAEECGSARLFLIRCSYTHRASIRRHSVTAVQDGRTTLPSPQPERRLAAILYADMVGYSRLMELGETSTLEVLRAIWDGLAVPVVAAGGGRIVGTAGDSMLALLASVIADVHYAVALQRALAERPAATPDRAPALPRRPPPRRRE